MFPPAIPIKRCPHCLAQLDGRSAVCSHCKQKLLKKRNASTWFHRSSIAFMVTGLAGILAAVYILTGDNLSSLALVCGLPGLFFLLTGLLARRFIKPT